MGQEKHGRSTKNMEEGGAEASEHVSMWPRDCSCDVLTKNMPAFCPCPKVCLRLN